MDRFLFATKLVMAAELMLGLGDMHARPESEVFGLGSRCHTGPSRTGVVLVSDGLCNA